MLRRLAAWFLDRQRRRTAHDAGKLRDSLRRRTLRVFTRPIQTLVSTAFVVAVVAALYLGSERPVAVQELLAAESVTVPEVLALFPPIYVLVPALVALAIFVNVARIWSGVRTDMGWRRRYRR